MFYPCFFMLLEHLHFYLVFLHVLASCSSMILVLFLALIFVHFYLVKLTFLQNIVNYDVWHTFGPLHVAGSAFEASFDVLPVFFSCFWNTCTFTSYFCTFWYLVSHAFGLVFLAPFTSIFASSSSQPVVLGLLGWLLLSPFFMFPLCFCRF